MKRYLLEVDNDAIATLDEASYTLNGKPAFTLLVRANDIKLEVLPELLAKFLTDRDVEKVKTEGQNEAWDLARKIVSSPNNGGYTCPELKDIFGSGLVGNCFRDNTYQEAIDKVKKWEETANICVGDVLVSTGNLKALVTYIGPDYMCLLFSDGSCGQVPKNDIKEFYKKTGQQFDVTTVVDLLKEEEE